MIFPKTAPTIFFKIGEFIKCYELLRVYEFYSDWNKERVWKLGVSQNKYFYRSYIVLYTSIYTVKRRALEFETYAIEMLEEVSQDFG